MHRTMSTGAAFAAAGLALVVGAGQASADLFTSRADFEAAFPALSAEDFEGIAPPNGCVDVSDDPGAFEGFTAATLCCGGGAAGVCDTIYPSAALNDGLAADTLSITFDNPAFAVGFNVGADNIDLTASEPVTVTAFAEDGAVLFTQEFNTGGFFLTTFVGLSNLGSDIARVDIFSSGFSAIDDLAFGVSAPFTIAGALRATDNPLFSGAPITTDGVFYQDDVFGGDVPPNAASIGFMPALAFDSYIALDGGNSNGEAGPSRGPDDAMGPYTAHAPQLAQPTVFGDDFVKINGAFGAPVGIESLFREDLGHHVVFFARLTVLGGSGGVEAPAVRVNIETNNGGPLAALDLTTGIENAVGGPDGGVYFVLVDQMFVELPDSAGACPADLNGDGAVDSIDLNVVLANFGAATDEGDVNGDGLVDSQDLNDLLGTFGEADGCPIGATVNDLYVARLAGP